MILKKLYFVINLSGGPQGSSTTIKATVDENEIKNILEYLSSWPPTHINNSSGNKSSFWFYPDPGYAHSWVLAVQYVYNGNTKKYVPNEKHYHFSMREFHEKCAVFMG